MQKNLSETKLARQNIMPIKKVESHDNLLGMQVPQLLVQLKKPEIIWETNLIKPKTS